MLHLVSKNMLKTTELKATDDTAVGFEIRKPCCFEITGTFIVVKNKLEGYRASTRFHGVKQHCEFYSILNCKNTIYINTFVKGATETLCN